MQKNFKHSSLTETEKPATIKNPGMKEFEKAREKKAHDASHKQEEAQHNMLKAQKDFKKKQEDKVHEIQKNFKHSSLTETEKPAPASPAMKEFEKAREKKAHDAKHKQEEAQQDMLKA